MTHELDNYKKTLKGSKSRDEFRLRHKNELPGDCFASDVDLVWVGKNGPLAAFDYKQADDEMNYNERILYEWISMYIPFFVLTEVSKDKFKVEICKKRQWKDHPDLISWSTLEKWRKALEEKESKQIIPYML